MVDRDAEIRRKAYEKWEQEGRREGDHERHWSEAEQEVGFAGEEKSPAAQSMKNEQAEAHNNSKDEDLEEGLEDSFPASDPISATSTTTSGSANNNMNSKSSAQRR